MVLVYAWLKWGDAGVSFVSWGTGESCLHSWGMGQCWAVLVPGLGKEKRGETGINALCPVLGCSSSAMRSRGTPQWQCLTEQQLQPRAWFVAVSVQDPLVPLLCPHPCPQHCPSYCETMVATSLSPGRNRPVPLHIIITQIATGLRASSATGTPQGPHDATGIQ